MVGILHVVLIDGHGPLLSAFVFALCCSCYNIHSFTTFPESIYIGHFRKKKLSCIVVNSSKFFEGP